MIRRETLALALALNLVFCPTARPAEPRASSGDFPFEQLAKEIAGELELPPGAKFQDVLDGAGFVRAEIGSFDVYLPVDSLTDASELELIRESVVALIDVQAAWTSWHDVAIEEAKSRASDWKALHKWAESWSVTKFGKVVGGGTPLAEQAPPRAKTREALARIRDLTASPKATADTVGNRNRIVLEPTRESFVRTIALAGLLDVPGRVNLWADLVLKQRAAWTGWTQIISLVGISYPFDIRNPYVQSSLSKEEPTGLAQHIAERAAVQMLRKQFYRHGTHFFEEALGTDLVIAATGRNTLRQGEWKLEYKTAGGHTEPYSRFVPGGNPAGGTLPPRRASAGPTTGSALDISRYRINGGVGFFRDSLHDGQKAGAKLASKNKEDALRKNKLAHFELHSFDPTGDTYVTAPFLGENTEGKALPPTDFLDDYEDFFRAYRACFFEWLREHGAGSTVASEARFAELITKHAGRKVGTPMYEVVQEVYGIPMSSADPETDSLEWRFLDWVSKGH